MNKILLLIATLMIGNISFAQTGEFVPELQALDAAMLNLLEEYDVPGAQLALTYQGRLVYNRGFGEANTFVGIPVTPNSIFRLASVSKPITSIGIMYLIEQEELELDDLVFGTNGILNDGPYSDFLDERVEDITVQHLLEHSGGWNRDLSGDPMFNAFAIATAMGVEAPADQETVIEYTLSNQMLDFTPGSEYQYSNFGYCILGRIIEKITGLSYEEYIKSVILEPLGINNMHCGYNLAESHLPEEVNYYDFPGAPYAYSVYDNSTLVPWPYGGFNLEAMDAHGGWVASAADLCRLLVAVDGFDTKPDILTNETISIMINPSVNEPYYALGWSVNPFNNWWHTGSLPGTSTEWVRASNGLNWAILLNTRNQNPNPLIIAADQLVWNALPEISTWPDHDLFTSVEEFSDNRFLQVFPNPGNGVFRVKSSERIEYYTIYDAQGLLLESVYFPDYENELLLELSDCNAGIYFLNTVTKSGINSSQIIVE